MSPRDLILALFVVTVWGLSFVAIRWGVDEVAPLLMTALRYKLAALPAVFFVRRPIVAWRVLIAYGLAIGVGQFGLLFVAIKWGEGNPRRTCSSKRRGGSASRRPIAWYLRTHRWALRRPRPQGCASSRLRRVLMRPISGPSLRLRRLFAWISTNFSTSPADRRFPPLA